MSEGDGGAVRWAASTASTAQSAWGFPGGEAEQIGTLVLMGLNETARDYV